MVSVDYMMRSALCNDTSISRAMLRACGVAIPHRLTSAGSIVSVDKYDCIVECFANKRSPMDGR